MLKNTTRLLGSTDIADGYNGKRCAVWLVLDESDGAILAVYDSEGSCGYLRYRFIDFHLPQYECTWTILYYARNGAWVCRENRNDTTCEFYEKDIFSALCASAA